MAVEIIGADILIEGLDKHVSLERQRNAVKDHTSKLQKRAMKNAVFSRGYSTGATKRSISLSIEGDGLTGRVKAKTHYSGYVEVGTRFMSAQPFMKPAYEAIVDGFVEDLIK